MVLGERIRLGRIHVKKKEKIDQGTRKLGTLNEPFSCEIYFALSNKRRTFARRHHETTHIHTARTGF